MKILVRYLFMNLLMPLLYLLLAFSLLFIIGDLMDNADEFFSTKASPAMMLHYYSLQLPSMVIFIVPICLLLATLYSLSMLTRHSEITAMRASGVSIFRIVRPYMLMGFLCFLLTALVNEFTGPKYAYRAHQLLESQKKSSEEVYYAKIPYENPTDGHTWYIEKFDTRTFTMEGVTLRKRREDGSDLYKITARKGRWLDGRWWFENGTVQRYDRQNNLIQRFDADGNSLGSSEPFHTREMRDVNEIPEDFLGEAKSAEHQSSLELWNYIQSHQFLSPETLVKYETDFHHKLTMPFICIIATLIGIPVGAHTGRKGAFAGIMLAIAMFFGFYGSQFVLEYLAKQMIVLPWAAAWGPVIAFYFIGSAMIYRMR
ncbi:LptF/LptG family permease [Pontiella sp.]|uniref:LptF/LptG family permease n=1 Tax=Pontiella sp. TaxID=2837462 RepID=UPI003562BFB3